MNIKSFFLLLLFISIGYINCAQNWITGVSFSPNPVNDCDNISVIINGNLSASNCTYISSHVISGNNITIDINTSCSGIGIPVITPYTTSLAIGMIPSNNYTLTVNQYSPFGLQETNVSILDVGTCCDAISSISLLSSSNCIGEVTSFLDGGTIADSLVWTDNGTLINPSPSAVGWGHIFSNSGVHNVVLTAIDSSGCSDSTNLLVTVNDLPAINMSSVAATCSVCADGEALVTVLSGQSPYLFVWSVGGTSNPLIGLNPGNYNVTLTDGNTCSVVDSVEVMNSVGVFNEAHKWVVYPNPTKDLIYIEKENYDSPILIELYNFNGKHLTSVKCNKLSLKDYPRGIYLLKVTSNDKVELFKVINQ